MMEPIASHGTLGVRLKVQSVWELAHEKPRSVSLQIAEAETDMLIGDLGLFLDADLTKGEIGFTLSSGAQGSGHATRATQAAIELIFASSPASEVRAVTDARNESSVRVLERAGFHQAGEQQAIFKGEACIELVYVYRRRVAL